MNPWLILCLSIALEVCGTVCLKLSDGMSRPLPILGVILFYLSAFALMSTSLKSLEIGIVYAIWAAAGTALIAIIGIVFFGESIASGKIVGLAFVIAGVVLLKVSNS
ncbi:MAG: QacE family quaternary ammonium compound efflux SMR transporter [Verrucomicrobia bacterium]|jgi:small multidrug resistance pump|nr:QacE family quaternary ammonium compound efflux SMR transporter [Verrucomicrobiota bacterium]NBS87366.1 QacE family quaternary ammonium compound efflux SMR transporter [Verrucomicrobiota bacterium]